MDRSNQIDTFSRLFQVSRETIRSLEKYEELVINANKKQNLIGNSTINEIWNRHFLDSAQVIDFIDKNDKTLIDIGSGAGFPGLILAIAAKDRKMNLKINLFEKSPKKIIFLNQIIKNLKLDVLAINKNVQDENLKIPSDIDYDKFSGLSNEVKAKFKQIRPKTLGQALRIDGITPAAAYILLSHVKKGYKKLKRA